MMNAPISMEVPVTSSNVSNDLVHTCQIDETSEAPSLLNYRRIAVAIGEGASDFVAKTGIGVLRYRAEDVIGVIASDRSGQSAQDAYGAGGSIPVVSSLNEIPSADSVFIGTAPLGGRLTESLNEIIRMAIHQGIDVVSGLHEFLSDDPQLQEAASRTGSRLIDLRKNRIKIIGQGLRFRPECLRIHTVGHDCSVGKMTVSLEIEKELKKRSLDAQFLATGQTGIMIAGNGIPVDCVVSDFVNGAVEDLVWRHQEHDILLVEGQGCLTHPAYSGVTLGLLHGCAPQGLILCYEVGRTHVKGLTDIEIPSLECLRTLYETMASQRHPCRVIGVAMNSKHVSEEGAKKEAEEVQVRLGLPVCDVFRDGPGVLVDAILKLRDTTCSSVPD